MKMKQKSISVIMGILGVFSAYGCTSNSLKVANQSLSLPPQVVINNVQLQKEITIGIGSDRTNDNDILEAFVDVQSKVSNAVTLQYRFRWFDKEDYEVGQNMSMWLPLFLEPKDSIKVTGVAPTPKADSFKFYLKKGN